MQMSIVALYKLIENLTAEIIIGAVLFWQRQPYEPAYSRTDKVAVFVVCVKRKSVLLQYVIACVCKVTYGVEQCAVEVEYYEFCHCRNFEVAKVQNIVGTAKDCYEAHG